MRLEGRRRSGCSEPAASSPTRGLPPSVPLPVRLQLGRRDRPARELARFRAQPPSAIRVVLTVGRSLPVFPQKRKSHLLLWQPCISQPFNVLVTLPVGEVLE